MYNARLPLTFLPRLGIPVQQAVPPEAKRAIRSIAEDPRPWGPIVSCVGPHMYTEELIHHTITETTRMIGVFVFDIPDWVAE